MPRASIPTSRSSVSVHFLHVLLVEGGFWPPIPRQELVETAHRVPARHAFKDVREIGKGLDVVEFCGGDERAHGRPTISSAVRSGKQVVLATERNWPDCAFNRVGVEFEAAIAEEAAKGIPAGEGVADGLGETAFWRELHELPLKPGLEGCDERQRSQLTLALPFERCPPAD